MMNIAKPLYVPGLRMKAGELQGVRELSSDIADSVLPRFIVPPRKERDHKQGVLFSTQDIPGVGRTLAEAWKGRDAMLDPAFLFDDFGSAEAHHWLPAMYESSRKAGVTAIPVATISDILGSRFNAFSKSINRTDTLQFALRVESGELVDPSFSDELAKSLEALKLRPQRCMLLADFSDATFDEVTVVAEIIDATLQDFQTMGEWAGIAFQGTNFPSTNPAEHGSNAIVPRNEWLSWKRACSFDRDTSDQLIFGDFAADCAKFEFGEGGGRAIRHYRYTTKDAWLVERGKATGKDRDVMQDVCSRILSSGKFAGRSFSSADEYISKTAKGIGGPGNSTIWRQINTTHHITQVVRDIGAVRGLKFSENQAPSEPFQLDLL